MKKHIMLGVKNKKLCCVLECLIPFSSLIPDQIESSDFKHSSTNWSGCDKLQRTTEIMKLKLTGNIITLPSPITFHGEDHDMGHTYPWSFEINEIYEVTPE